MFSNVETAMASIERLTLQGLAQVSELIYYHPAWSMICLMFLYSTLQWLFMGSIKKRFTPDRPTNIVITGAAQGLGKQLAEQFVRRHQPGSVNLIIVDIREDLKPQLIKDIKTVAGCATFKNIHFYKANLADTQVISDLWGRIRNDHGPVHILVNNHAICRGKRVSELTIEQFKLTMDINFNSYVQLCMLFLGQQEINHPLEGQRFHLANVNSIAGHMTCQRNSDYSASKFALSGFTDALRQELEISGSPVKMTNFYPYYINTGLFEGFQPAMGWIMPTLKADKVTRRMHQSIMCEDKEVFIEPIVWWLKIATSMLPLSLRNKMT